MRLFREDGLFRFAEAEILTNLGEAHRALRDHKAARDIWQQAIAALDEVGHPDADEVRARLTQLCS